MNAMRTPIRTAAKRALRGPLDPLFGGGSAPWTPSALIGEGDAGEFFAPSGAWYTDAGKTSQASVYDDTLEVWAGANGTDLIADVSATGPSLVKINGVQYGQFGRASTYTDKMAANSLGPIFDGDYTVAYLFSQTLINTGAYDSVSSPRMTSSAAAFDQVALQSSNVTAWSRGTSGTDAAIVLGAQTLLPRSVIIKRNGTSRTADIWLDGVKVVSGATYRSGAAAFNEFAIGWRPVTATTYSAMNMGGLFMVDRMTDGGLTDGAETTQLIEYFESLRLQAATVDLFLVVGDSNAAGRGSDAAKRPAVSPSAGLEYYATTMSSFRNGGFYDMDEGLMVANRGFGSMCPALANAYNSATGNRAAVINYGVGSTTLLAAADFGVGNWSSTGTLRAAALAAANEAIAQINASGNQTLGQVFVVIDLGVNDASQLDASVPGVSGAAFQAEFEALGAYYAANLTQFDGMIVSQIGSIVSDPTNAAYATIRTAISDAVAASANLTMGYTGAYDLIAAGKMEDNIHHDQDGLNEKGAALATAAVAIGSAPDTIQDQSFTFGAKTLAGAGAVDVVSTAGTPSYSITGGDPSSHWQINSSTGALTPAAAGVAASLSGAPYSLTVSDGTDSATVTVAAVANRFNVSSAAESDAAKAAAVDGDTIRWRSGLTITGSRIDYTGLSPATGLTIDCDSNRGTTLPGINLTGSSNITVDALKLNRDWQSGDTTADFVVVANQTTDCTINDCEVWSTDLSTITPQLNAEVINGIGCLSGANVTDGLTVTDCFIHDVWRPISAVGPNMVVQGNTFLDCFQNFGEFGNATSLVYKDNRGDGIWANGTDTGNPHSSLLGFSATATTNGILVEGNILVTGPNRFNALADKAGLASGPKFNDTTGNALLYTNAIVRYNAFVPTDSIGLEIAFGPGFNIHHNLIALDPAVYSSATPSLYWHDVGSGSKAWANIAAILSEGADFGSGVHQDWYDDSFDNIVARPVHASFAQSGEAFSYPELFNGPTFTGLTSSQIEAAFTAKTGGRLLAPSINIGPFGTGYYNFATGVETAPTYAKPITTTATGVDLTGVIFDGTNDFAVVTDATDPLLGMTNDDEFTLLFEIEVDASDDGQDVYLLQSAGAGLSVRKLASNFIRLTVENVAGDTIVSADSSEKLTSADGSTVIAISCRMSTYDIRFMKGVNVDGLLKVTEFTGEAYDNDRNSLNIMSATGGTNRMAGTLSAVYISDQFIDLHSASVLDAVVALDGKPDDWGADGSTVTGTQPEFYATGNAAAWNDVAGINLGSDANKAIVTGAVADTTPPAITREFLGAGFDGTNGSSYSSGWSALPGIDSGDAGKVAVVIIGTSSLTAGAVPTAVTIGGNAATKQVGSATNTDIDASVSIWTAVLSSTTDAVTVTYGAAVNACGYSVILLDGASGATAADTGENIHGLGAGGTTNSVAGIDTPAGGVCIAATIHPFTVAVSFAGDGGSSFTKHNEFNVENGSAPVTATNFAVASSIVDNITGETITVTQSNNESQLVVATFGP